MQKQQLSKVTRTVYTILRQIATLIPREFVTDAAEANRVKWRTFDPWSHLPTLVIVQLSRLSGVIRGSLWLKKRLLSLLDLYGTAGAVIIPRHRVKSPYFQPLLNFANAPNGTADAEMPRNAVS